MIEAEVSTGIGRIDAVVKTSGGKGLHVVAPLTPKADWDTVKAFTRDIASQMEINAPDRYVATMTKSRRKGRIFVDYLRNQRGATAICPFSTRTKSGAYTVWRPLQLGALAGGAGPDLLAVLREYGRHAGQAFALRDDVLGVVGDPARTGKPAGDDLIAGKPTVLLALAAERFGPGRRRELRRIGREPVSAEDVARLAAELRRCGVIEEVEGLIVHRTGAFTEGGEAVSQAAIVRAGAEQSNTSGPFPPST